MKLDEKKLSQLMMELFTNPELKEKFINEPIAVLKEKGFEIPENKKIKVVEETEDTSYFVIPYVNSDEKLETEIMENRSNKTSGRISYFIN